MWTQEGTTSGTLTFPSPVIGGGARPWPQRGLGLLSHFLGSPGRADCADPPATVRKAAAGRGAGRSFHRGLWFDLCTRRAEGGEAGPASWLNH